MSSHRYTLCYQAGANRGEVMVAFASTRLKAQAHFEAERHNIQRMSKMGKSDTVHTLILRDANNENKVVATVSYRRGKKVTT